MVTKNVKRTALKEVAGIENVKFINQAAFQGCALTGTLNLNNAVAIANHAFSSNPAIKEVNLPATLQSLGAYAFGANTALESVNIAAEKIKLGQYAFTDCTSLKSISINASVIPAGAFNMCKSLSSVTLGKDVSVISEYAFRNTAVSRFDVAEGNSTFVSCDNGEYLTNAEGNEILLVAPTKASFSLDDKNITSVGNAAFSGSNRLISVNLPYVTYVGDYAFSECESLNEITLGKLTHIGSFAFENTNLKSFEFDSDITIGDYAFSRGRIESVIIPDGLTVPEGCFYNCTNLTSVVIGDNVTVGINAFFNDKNHAEKVYDVQHEYFDSTTGKTSVLTLTIYNVMLDGPITSLIIGDNVILESGAFYGAASLSEITMGVNAVIGDYAFYNCASLEKITNLDKATKIGEGAFSGDIHFSYTKSDYSAVYINENNEYVYTYYAPKLTSIDISSVTELGKNAFAACKYLESVTLGDNLTIIPDSAFQACEKLTRVNLDKVNYIGGYAFAECNLSNINIGCADFIGEYAFCNNEELLSVVMATSNIVIEEGAFSYCKSLMNIVGDDRIKYVGDYAFAYSALSGADLSSAEYIGTHAFYKEEFIKFDLKIGKTLKDMGDNPFANCEIAPIGISEDKLFGDQVIETETLYTFDLSESIKIIDGSIYRVVPKGLELITWMGETTAEVAEGTVRISAMAFSGDDVQMVVLPSTVAAIGHKAFFNCNSLVFITFTSYRAPILEEEFDNSYYESMQNIPAKGTYDFVDNFGFPIYYDGIEITPYFMWNVSSLPSNFFYGANFVDYVGHVDNKLTMIRPTNGRNYDSFIMDQYFDLKVDGAAAADEITLAAIAAIKLIPQNVRDIKLEHKPIIEAARAAYDLITSFEQRALISNDVLAILTAAEQRISDLEHLADTTPDDTVVDDDKVNVKLIITIIIGIIFILVVIAFIVVLVIFIRMIKKGLLILPAKNNNEGDGENKKPNLARGTPIIHKATPVPKLQKKEAIKLVNVEDLMAKKASGTEKMRKILVIVAIVVAVALVVGGIIWIVASNNNNIYKNYDEEGYTVRVTFDVNGGTFKGSDSTVVDMFKPEQIGEDGIKLLAPDDKNRDKSNTLTVTKAGYFLAGWYTNRELVDENNPELGYTYSGKWNFETDRLTLEEGKNYTAEESALTLYAAWVPYYNYEIYAKNDAGEDVLISSVSAINLTIPEWKEGDVTLGMDNFPKRDGYTLDKVYYYDTMTEVEGTANNAGTKKVITGQWDEATATSLTPTIKLYTTWVEGERYRIYSTEDLRKNADANGYYEIYSDLDFSNSAYWAVAS